jgi:hydroxymethylglutaryl-CoA lyase
MLADAGFTVINATSFVSAQAVPQMADAEQVMGAIRRSPKVTYDASVPNRKGAERAVAAGVDELVVFVAANDADNLKNVHRTTQESMREAQEIIEFAGARGVPVIGTVSHAFSSGETTPAKVLALARLFVDAGAAGIALGDTIGEAVPSQVTELAVACREQFPNTRLSLHLHDTRGLAMANVIAGMDAGVIHFDSAIGGIGGSPFASVIAGNVSTEDLVYMCEKMGIETGINLGLVLDAYRFLEDLLGPLPSKHSHIGRQTIMHEPRLTQAGRAIDA